MSFEQPTIEKNSGLYDSTKKRLEEFINIPESPGLPYEEQLKLREISERTQSKEDIENYERSKESKYRANTLSTPLIMGEAFLRRAPEAGEIPEETKTELLKRIKIVAESIRAKNPSQLISKENVDEVVDIVKNIQAFLK
ncbi:MAG: hypothetical protein HZB99_03700 [Candidatus Harrisonbacteria bacterium]|nr:hypothetical protein [Candidatus Harrisonbacteria bacterium]